MKFLVEGAKPQGPVYSFSAAGLNLLNAAPFNTVLHVVTPTRKLFSSLLQNYNFAAVMNRNVNNFGDCQWGCDPQVENHSFCA